MRKELQRSRALLHFASAVFAVDQIALGQVWPLAIASRGSVVHVRIDGGEGD